MEAVPWAAGEGAAALGVVSSAGAQRLRRLAHERRSKAFRKSPFPRGLTSLPSRVETHADKDCRLRGGLRWGVLCDAVRPEHAQAVLDCAVSLAESEP